MLATLNGALEVRGVHLPPEAVQATVRGINEMKDRIPVLTRIEIDYRLRVPAASREVVDRALASHQDKCPTARSLAAAVEVVWSAEVTEE